MTAHQQFVVTLRAVPDQAGIPTVIRLRRGLKVLLRSFGLRCTAIRESDEQSESNHASTRAPRENAPDCCQSCCDSGRRSRLGMPSRAGRVLHQSEDKR